VDIIVRCPPKWYTSAHYGILCGLSTCKAWHGGDMNSDSPQQTHGEWRCGMLRCGAGSLNRKPGLDSPGDGARARCACSVDHCCEERMLSTCSSMAGTRRRGCSPRFQSQSCQSHCNVHSWVSRVLLVDCLSRLDVSNAQCTWIAQWAMKVPACNLCRLAI
jgi:hypothetical protein